MKEYGGYIELDRYTGSEYYSDLVSLNCGRSCLRYLIEAKNIKKIYLPFFLCDTVKMACEVCGISYEYYLIDKAFKPVFDKVPGENEYLYIVNYYGQLTDDYIKNLKQKYKNIIIDNAQAFFRKPLPDMDTIYIARKFFGVADGAYLATDCKPAAEYPVDISYDKMNFLLGRFEKTASEFYEEYVNNNLRFDNEEIKYTSKLTSNLLRAVDYEFVKKRREENFAYMDERLKKYNQLSLHPTEGPFAYPLLIENGSEVRKKLQQIKIYVPTLWPDVFSLCAEDSMEHRYARDILPLPIDQRYDAEDMKVICDSVLKHLV